MCRQASTARTRLAVVWARLDGRLKRSLPSSLALTRHSGEKLRTSPRVACRVASASIPQPRSFPSKVSRHRCRSALRAFNRALGINNAGQVVGYADSYPVLGRQPALWDGASLTGLASYGYAFAINDKGQIAADTVLRPSTTAEFRHTSSKGGVRPQQLTKADRSLVTPTTFQMHLLAPYAGMQRL